MTQDEIFKLTDRDLPPANRTEANLWRAKTLHYFQELGHANKGLRRLRFRLSQFYARAALDAAEIERLRGEKRI